VRILVSNDDGIYAPGLWTLARELSRLGEVVVVAPDREQSGVGTSVTLHNPIRLRRLEPLAAGVECYCVEGTPADSVILGIRWVMKGEVDVVVAGINEGANLGNDVFISGTVGAAFQGYFYGLPSISVSVAALEDLHFEPAAGLARLLVEEIGKGSLPGPFLLNVNLPNVPLSEVKGIEVTRLGRRSYGDIIQEGYDGKRKYYWIVRGNPEWEARPGTDILAIREGKVSLTPLGFHFPDSLVPRLKELCPLLLGRLKGTA